MEKWLYISSDGHTQLVIQLGSIKYESIMKIYIQPHALNIVDKWLEMITLRGLIFARDAALSLLYSW